MKKFYIHNGQTQFGPYTIDELKSLNITQETSIWFEGLPSWQLARNIGELKNLFIAPPPFHTPNYSQDNNQSIETPAFKTGRSLGRWLWIGLITGILILVAVFMYNQITEQKYREHVENLARKEEDNRKLTRTNITALVTAQRSAYQYYGLGGIRNLKISVNNHTDYILDKVQVKVTYLKPDRSVWDNKLIDFNYIDRHTQITLPVEDTNRGVSVEYEIISIKSSALGL